MHLRIVTLEKKKLVGLKSTMNLANDSTPILWRSLIMRRKEILNNLNNDLISMQVYDSKMDFNEFSPHTKFVKWAAVEVEDFDNIPDGMERFILPESMYAVFIHRGLPNDFPKTAQYIFGTWLPKSDYALDDRPHFEVLGAKYKNNDPNSEEEVWIPIKYKSY